ncbi:MAG: hypothetical protein ACT4ON_11085 [Bacteroidota bacterium]
MKKGNDNQINFKPIHIDKHIWLCLCDLFEEKREGEEVDWREIKNRNPTVPKPLWEEVLWRHLHHFNYN